MLQISVRSVFRDVRQAWQIGPGYLSSAYAVTCGSIFQPYRVYGQQAKIDSHREMPGRPPIPQCNPFLFTGVHFSCQSKNCVRYLVMLSSQRGLLWVHLKNSVETFRGDGLEKGPKLSALAACGAL
jgi:hypothetical protein